VELQTKRLQLAQAKRSNEEYEQREEQRHRNNKMRQAQLAGIAAAEQSMVAQCYHKSGGYPKNILHGGGSNSFSLITRAVMPDGVTILLQCSRCRMKLYPPTQKLRKADPKQYKADLQKFNDLLKLSEEAGAPDNVIMGPTFAFKNEEGVPFIPERV
jgi:hypothetical protein